MRPSEAEGFRWSHRSGAGVIRMVRSRCLYENYFDGDEHDRVTASTRVGSLPSATLTLAKHAA